MRARLASEQGWALVTALLLMTMMLSAGLAVASYARQRGQPVAHRAQPRVGVQPRRGRAQRPGVRARAGLAGGGRGAVDQYATAPRRARGAVPEQHTAAQHVPDLRRQHRRGLADAVRDNNVTGAPNFYSDALTANARRLRRQRRRHRLGRAQATARARRAPSSRSSAPSSSTRTSRARRCSPAASRLGNNGSNGNKQFIDNGTSASASRRAACPAPRHRRLRGAPVQRHKYFPDGIQTAISPYRYSSDTSSATRSPPSRCRG